MAADGTLYWAMTPGVVAETDLAGTLKSEYVFFDGERVARRDGATGAGGVFYYFSDHLKTASVITDSAGVIKAESDYYPWGGELQFVNNDSNDYKFTGKKRDLETGLDYFGARYYSNGLGRFVTPDWAAKATAVPYALFNDPQTLNLYTYVGGNPASKADPDGHCFWDACAVETYLVVTGAVALTAAALSTPAGQNAIKAGVQIADHATSWAANGLRSLFSSKSKADAPPVPTAGAVPGTQTKSDARPGTLGKADHQATVKAEADRIGGKTEVKIPTPIGSKDSRRADAVGTNPETGAPEIVQVYRPTPAGNIPKREVDAARDIEDATGVKPTMKPVQPQPQPQPEPQHQQ